MTFFYTSELFESILTIILWVSMPQEFLGSTAIVRTGWKVCEISEMRKTKQWNLSQKVENLQCRIKSEAGLQEYQ